MLAQSFDKILLLFWKIGWLIGRKQKKKSKNFVLLTNWVINKEIKWEKNKRRIIKKDEKKKEKKKKRKLRVYVKSQIINDGIKIIIIISFHMFSPIILFFNRLSLLFYSSKICGLRLIDDPK